jgi:hypothetical protein
LARKEEYLARAKEADREAERVKDLDMQKAWKRIADDYRALASMADGLKSLH